MSRIETELRALIGRHEGAAETAYGPDTQGFSVAIAELRNLLEPGSAPMYARDLGHTATCEVCMPDGDGVSNRFQKR